jgi:hypothetical protein
MNRMRAIAIFTLATAASVSPLLASAQTCTAPRPWQGSDDGISLALDTCDGDSTGAALMCGGTQDRVGPVYVLRSTINSNRGFTEIALSGAAPGFDPVMFMTPATGGCGANQETCFPSGDTGAPIRSADVPDGDWLILITAFGQNAPGTCGPVTLTAGPLPVSLVRFTVD